MNFETKYRPQTFSDLVFSDINTRQRLLEYANNRRHGNIVLHGPFGTAKSTTAQIIQKMRLAMANQTASFIYHAAEIEEKTLQLMLLTWSNQKVAGVQHPLIIIDEIDQMKRPLKNRLRHLMDKTHWGSFILTTNNLRNVDDGIVDRCDVIELPATNQAAWFDRAKYILQTEGHARSDEDINRLLSDTTGSIRDVMRGLEDAEIRFSKMVPAQATQPPTPVAPMSVHLIPPLPEDTTP